MTVRKADHVARRTSTPKAVDGDVRSGPWSGVEWSPRFVDMAGLQTAVAIDGSLNDDSDIDLGWSWEVSIPWTSLELLANGRSLPPRPEIGRAHV